MNSQKIGRFDYLCVSEATQLQQVLIASHNVLGSGRLGAFQNSVVGRVFPHGLHRLLWINMVRIIIDPFLRLQDGRFIPTELQSQNAGNLRMDRSRDGEADNAGPRKIQKLIRRAAEVQCRNVNIAVRSY